MRFEIPNDRNREKVPKGHPHDDDPSVMWAQVRLPSRVFGHGFGHGSVTVLVTVLNLSQAHSSTMPRRITPASYSVFPHSVTLHRPPSHSSEGRLRIRRLQVQVLSGAPLISTPYTLPAPTFESLVTVLVTVAKASKPPRLIVSRKWSGERWA